MIRRIDARTDQGRAALEAFRSSLSIEHGTVSGEAAWEGRRAESV
ncbi:MAG TPA: hypothetical protein VM219_07105 [Phycisphaerae bacterium]|nr:hypothetical protein [Phycisphaerae bacterium]